MSGSNTKYRVKMHLLKVGDTVELRSGDVLTVTAIEVRKPLSKRPYPYRISFDSPLDLFDVAGSQPYPYTQGGRWFGDLDSQVDRRDIVNIQKGGV